MGLGKRHSHSWAIENGLIGSDGTADETAVAAGLSDVKIDFAVTPDGQHTILDGRDG